MTPVTICRIKVIMELKPINFMKYTIIPMNNDNKKEGSISRNCSLYLYPKIRLLGAELIKVLSMLVTISPDAITKGPYETVIKRTINPNVFFIISNFKKRSLRPIAFKACKFAVWMGHKPYVKQKMQR